MENKVGQKFNPDAIEGREWPEMQEFCKHLQGNRIAWCWGPHRFTKWGDKLVFLVQGHLHKGIVVLYVNGSDLFDIILLNQKRYVKHIEKDVYLEDLIDRIDGLVETAHAKADHTGRD